MLKIIVDDPECYLESDETYSFKAEYEINEDEVTCDDVMEVFIKVLKDCTFHETSIARTMKEWVYWYEQDNGEIDISDKINQDYPEQMSFDDYKE